MFRPLLALALLLVLPASAHAAVYTGKTDQGKPVRIYTRGGYVAHMTIASRCHGATTTTTIRPRAWQASRLGVALNSPDGDLRMAHPGAGWRGTWSTCEKTIHFRAGSPTHTQRFYVGLSQQHRIAVLVAGSDNVVSDFRIAWDSRCSGGSTYGNITTYRSFAPASPTAFGASGTYSLGADTVFQTVSGRAHDGLWSGTVQGTVRGGNHCTLSRVHWRATRI